jgi:hypothetical integral membrane protein (TIGR02206 family)
MGFLFDESYARDFQLFGWLHILILCLGAGGLVGLYLFREQLKRPAVGRIFRYSIAALLTIAESTYQVWIARRNGFNWVEFAPLGLCGMMVWITVVALAFDLKQVSKVVIPWAFVGTTLSFVVVNMGSPSYTFPHFRFFHYFGIHWMFLAGNLYFLFAGRFTYTYKDLLRSTAWLAGVSAGVLLIDLATGQNFMFLREWPDEMHFLARFLPFPLSTVALVAGAFILFNVFYLVFVVRRFDARPPTVAARVTEPAPVEVA